MLNVPDRESYPTVDYGKPIAVVYAEAMVHIFSKGIGPHFLLGMWLPGLQPVIPGLPSWVSDFSAQSAGRTAGQSCIGFNPAFPRSVSGPGAEAVNGVAQEDMKTLQVEALPIDIITKVIHFETDFLGCVAQLENIESLATEVVSRAAGHKSLGPIFDKFKQSEPLWRILVSDKTALSGYDAVPDQYAAMYDELLAHCSRTDQQDRNPQTRDLPENGYIQALRQHLPGRAFFTTFNGLIGLAGPSLQADDEVTIWFGATIPFIVRHNSDTHGHCKLVSGAYVGGIMKGEMVDQLYCEDLLDSKTLLVR